MRAGMQTKKVELMNTSATCRTIASTLSRGVPVTGLGDICIWKVADLSSTVEELRGNGVRFRNDIVTGVGGKQILLEDPSGNPIELFEPTLPEAALRPS